MDPQVLAALLSKASSVDVLNYVTMTAAINEMKSPNDFLQRLIFKRRVTLPTETIELGFFDKGRAMAPMVKRGAEALIVDGYTSRMATVSTPNIRIKRPMEPNEVLFGRRPGNIIHAEGGTIAQAAAEHVARELQILRDLITNRVEWMCAQVLDGTITYAETDNVNELFSITTRPSTIKTATNFTTLPATVGGFWDTGTTKKPFEDVVHFKRVMTDQVGLSPMICLHGKNVTSAIFALARADAGFAAMIRRDSNIASGSVSVREDFSDSGALYVATIGGVEFWEYSRTAVDETGTAREMIPASWGYFLNTSAAAEWIIYYGAIADVATMQGRSFQTQIFSKSWIEQDPSQIVHLAHTRPLPFIRRPGAIVSAKLAA
ncbi:MAG: major capsid protein [Actinomycetota bacterium]